MANTTVVLLVHGMGTHAKGQMIKDFKKAISDRATGFGISQAGLINTIDYREFNYSDYLDAVRKQFAENAQARARGFAFLAGKGFDNELVGQLGSFEAKFDKDEFFYTHWLDVILYGTTYFGEKIRLDFIKKFESLRKSYGEENLHVVFHSLGTAVVHDALAKYYRTDANVFDNIPDLPTGDFNFSSLWTFANVSRMVNILNGLTDPNHSTVVTGSEGCTEDFFNVRHQYDPFTWYKTYDRPMEHKTSFVPRIIRNINTHDFYEYVTEPKVARKILSLMYGKNITDSQFNLGVADFKNDSLTCKARELRDLVDSARNDASIDDLKKAFGKYKEIVEEIERQKAS